MAKSSLASAQSQYDHAVNAKELQISSINTQISMAQGNVSSIYSKQQNEFIFSPLNGTITEKYVEKGEIINTGQILAKVADLSSLKVQAEIPESIAKKLKIGDKISLEVFDNKKEVIISKIEPSSDLISKKVLIEGILDNSDKSIKSGTFARVEISFDGEEAKKKILIPFSAVNFKYRKSYVFIVQDNKAIKKEIEVGEIYGNDIEVLSGLSVGEELILSNVVDNEKIER